MFKYCDTHILAYINQPLSIAFLFFTFLPFYPQGAAFPVQFHTHTQSPFIVRTAQLTKTSVQYVQGSDQCVWK